MTPYVLFVTAALLATLGWALMFLALRSMHASRSMLNMRNIERREPPLFNHFGKLILFGMIGIFFGEILFMLSERNMDTPQTDELKFVLPHVILISIVIGTLLTEFLWRFLVNAHERKIAESEKQSGIAEARRVLDKLFRGILVSQCDFQEEELMGAKTQMVFSVSQLGMSVNMALANTNGLWVRAMIMTNEFTKTDTETQFIFHLHELTDKTGKHTMPLGGLMITANKKGEVVVA